MFGANAAALAQAKAIAKATKDTDIRSEPVVPLGQITQPALAAAALAGAAATAKATNAAASDAARAYTAQERAARAAGAIAPASAQLAVARELPQYQELATRAP